MSGAKTIISHISWGHPNNILLIITKVCPNSSIRISLARTPTGYGAPGCTVGCVRSNTRGSCWRNGPPNHLPGVPEPNAPLRTFACPNRGSGAPRVATTGPWAARGVLFRAVDAPCTRGYPLRRKRVLRMVGMRPHL